MTCELKSCAKPGKARHKYRPSSPILAGALFQKGETQPQFISYYNSLFFLNFFEAEEENIEALIKLTKKQTNSAQGSLFPFLPPEEEDEISLNLPQ